MKGTPYLYQGDEIGMTNVVNTKISQYQDIESANFAKEKQELGWSEEKIMSYLLRNSRDNARTPMQWNHQEHAGIYDRNAMVICQWELQRNQCGKQQEKSGFSVLLL